MPRRAAVEGPATPDLRSSARRAGRTRRRLVTASPVLGVLVAGVLVAGLIALTGCAGTPDPDPSGADPAPTLPAGVTVELTQLRADVAPRQAQVRVTNESAVTIAVGEVRVEDPRFDGPAVRVSGGRVSTIPGGGSVDIRVQLPPVDCTASDDGEAEIVLELTHDDGSIEATASARDPLGFLAPLHARECLLERVTDAAALAFTGFRPAAPGEPAALQLTITPRGTGGADATDGGGGTDATDAADATDGADATDATDGRAAARLVRIVGVERTNLIGFAALPAEDEVYPVDVSVDTAAGAPAPPVAVELPIVPSRCDPHAVQEDKRGTIFPVRVEADGERGEVELFAGEELRGRILSWVAGWCGFGD